MAGKAVVGGQHELAVALYTRQHMPKAVLSDNTAQQAVSTSKVTLTLPSPALSSDGCFNLTMLLMCRMLLWLLLCDSFK